MLEIKSHLTTPLIKQQLMLDRLIRLASIYTRFMVAYDDVSVSLKSNNMVHVIWYRVTTVDDLDGKKQRFEYFTMREFPLISINRMMKKYSNDVSREFKDRHNNPKYISWLRS